MLFTDSLDHLASSFIQDFRNGSYLVGYLATVSGTYVVSVFLDANTAVVSIALNVMPSFPSVLFSRLDLSRSDMNMTVPAGRCSQASFLIKDQFNNSLNYVPSASYFAVEKLAPPAAANGSFSTSSCFGLVGVCKDYLTFKYLFTTAGSYTFSVIGSSCSMNCLPPCGCLPLPGSPYVINVLPTEPFAFTSYASGEAFHISRAGQISTFTINSMDQYNNSISFHYFNEIFDKVSGKKIFVLANVSNDHKYLNVVLRGPEIQVASIKNNLDGTLSLTYRVEKTGSYFVEIYYFGGIALNSGTSLTILPPDVFAPNTYAVYSRRPVAGDPFIVTLVSKDIFGNLMSIFGFKFNATCFSEGLVQSIEIPIEETSFQDLNNGNYTLTLYPTISASYWLAINILDHNPSAISGSPFQFRVQARNTTAAATTVAHGLGLEMIATAGIFNEFFIQAKDVFGNLRSTGGDKFSVQLVPTSQEKFNATIVTTFRDQQSGVYNFAYKVTKSGKYLATITVFGEKNLGTPYPITIYSAQLDVGGSGMSNFITLLTAGIEMTFIVNARDRFGNPRDEGGPQFAVNAIGNNTWAYSNVTGTVTDDTGGKYSGAITVYVSGHHRLYVTSNGTLIDNGLARYITVLPSAVSLESIVSNEILATAGLPFIFCIQARDDFANNRTQGGGQFSSQLVYLDGPLDDIFADVVDSNRGIFSASFTPTVSGKYAAFVQLYGNDVLLSPFAAYVQPGPGAIQFSSASGSGISIATVGSTASFTIYFMDSYRNIRTSFFAGTLSYNVIISKEDIEYDGSVFSDQSAIGSLIVSYKLTLSGHYHFAVTDSFGTQLSNSPLQVYLSPSDIFPSECEIILPEFPVLADLKATNLSLISRDRFRNQLSVSKSRFEVMLVDGRELSRRIVALTDGLYVFEVQSTVAGSRTINITHDGVEIKSSPLELTLNPNVAVPLLSAILGDFISLSTAG